MMATSSTTGWLPEIEEVEEEEIADPVRVFADYRHDDNVPGNQHPAELSEGAGLANVDPPAITHKLLILEKGHFQLSAPQNQAVVYATQANNDFFSVGRKRFRKGFLLGDGTGVGKTLSLVGIAYEAILNNYITRVLWIVPNKDLVNAAIADVKKMSPDVDCWELSRMDEDEYTKPGIAFVTYTFVSSEDNQDEVRDYLGEDFDGMLVLDECHFIKSAYSKVKKSKTGTFLMEIQEMHPNCRVIYSSATVASEPHHLLCLQRLHFWGEGANCSSWEDFSNRMRTLGVAGMELLSLDMKRRGVFLSRLISFKNVQVEMLSVENASDFLEVYSKSSEIFLVLLLALEQRSENLSGWDLRCLRSRFYSEQLRYFGCLMLSGKIRRVAETIVEKYRQGKSVVVTIQHTGESGFVDNGSPHCLLEKCLRRIYKLLGVKLGRGMLYVTQQSGFSNVAFDLPVDKSGDEAEINDEDIEEDVTDFVAPNGNLIEIARSIGNDQDQEPSNKMPKLEDVGFLNYSLAVLENIDQHFDNRDPIIGMSPSDFTWTAESCCNNATDEELARLFFEIRPYLPFNPLDELTDRLGSALDVHPCDLIANGTGRKFFYVEDQGEWSVEKTGSRDKEVNEFMDLKKRIIIISDASSVGVSLHADRNRENQQERNHFVIELPWSPEKLTQTLGRTLRSNAASTPIYIVVKTGVPTEARFLCVIEERMKQMGAICQGQSEASPLARYLSTNLNSKATVDAIRATINSCNNTKHSQLFSVAGITSKDGAVDVEKYVTKTFNRLMMLPVKAQNHFFKRMTDEISKLIADDGIFSDISGVDIPSGSSNADVTQISVDEWRLENGAVQLRTFLINRILTLDNLEQKIAAERVTHDITLPGYYKTAIGEVCYVIKEGTPGKNDWSYWTPYCKEVLTTKLPRNFKKVSDEMGQLQWKVKVEDYERNVGCVCAKRKMKCRQRLCTRKAGKHEITVICGFTYNIYDEIQIATTNAKSKIRLARVTWMDRGHPYHDVGLVLEPEVAVELKFNLDRLLAKERFKKSQMAAAAANPLRPRVTLGDLSLLFKK